MTVTVNELVDSRELEVGTKGVITTHWIAYEDDPNIPFEEGEALVELALQTPEIWASVGFTRREITVEPVGDPTISRMWKSTVTYKSVSQGSAAPSSTGDSYFNFDTGTTTVHMTQSELTYTKLGKVDPSNPSVVIREPTNWNRMINASEDEVKGADIIAPEYKFSETHYFDSDFVDAAYKQTLKALATKVNDAPFKGFGTSEVLFLNAVGSRRGTASSDGWEISYNFAVRDVIPVGKVIAPTIEPVPAAKSGWAYVWVGYERVDEVVGTKNRRKLIPQEAYLEEIYSPADFSLLGIGTT